MQDEREIEEQIADATMAPASMDIIDLGTLDEYTGEIESHWWTPNKAKPEKKIRLDLRMQALRGRDLNVIQRRARELASADSLIENLQYQRSQLRPSREIERKQQELAAISDTDYKTAEEAEAEREKLEGQIATLQQEFQAKFDQFTAKIEELSNQPALYQLLREQLFSKVVHDHTIGLNGKKLNFNDAESQDEPPFIYVSELQTFVINALTRGKASRRNGSSRR